MVVENYRVVPMRLFATWEVDRTSPNCVPRLCTMSMNRLTVLKPLDSETNCLVIAVKLQGLRTNKRTLRSNDLTVSPVNGIIDIDLDISFTLQYPHFVKRKDNCIQILLQRRKKYKNRPIPGGFKTIAVGTINLTNVLQSSVDRELSLFADEGKDDSFSESLGFGQGPTLGGAQGTGSVGSGGSGTPQSSTYGSQSGQQQPIAKLYMMTCNSQPVENEEVSLRKEKENEPPSDDDDDTADPESGSDSDPVTLDDPEGHMALMKRVKGGFPRFTPGRFGVPAASGRHQKNFKQKFLTLLKKFKISEEALSEVGESVGCQPSKEEIDRLMEEIENLSDSGPEMDDPEGISIRSTPKPTLPPFFPSQRSSREAIPEFVDMSGGNGSEESRESEASQPEMDLTDPEMVGEPPSPGKWYPAAGTRHGQDTFVTPPTSAREKEPLRPTATAPTQLDKDKEKKKKSLVTNKHFSADLLTTGGVTDPKITGSGASSGGPVVSSSRLKPSSQGGAPLGSLPPPGQSSPRLTPDLPPLKHAPISEQIAQRITPEDATVGVPESVWVLSATDVHCQGLVSNLRERQPRILLVTTPSDIRTVFSTLVNRIQKFCNTNSGAPRIARVCLVGGDRFLSWCLKSYTDIFAQKPTDWQNYVRFILVTPAWSTISRCLACIDPTFTTSQFCDNLWRDWWDKTELNTQEISEVSNRIHKYLLAAKAMMPMPIAEAMLQTRDKGAPDENSQVFVPFLVDCRSGGTQDLDLSLSSSVPMDPSGAGSPAFLPLAPGSQAMGAPSVTGQTLSSTCGSPPSGTVPMTPGRAGLSELQTVPGGQQGSPPASPHTGIHQSQGVSVQAAQPSGVEAQDLQIEYWASQPQGSHTSGIGRGEPQSVGGPMNPNVGLGRKETVKTAFKSLVISRMPHTPSQAWTMAEPTPTMSLQYTKEKKKDKILQKMGMKNKEKGEGEQRTQNVDGISRLICSSKHSTIRVWIDGIEWPNVKFFQLSSQWQTHVKHFPVALYHGD